MGVFRGQVRRATMARAATKHTVAPASTSRTLSSAAAEVGGGLSGPGREPAAQVGAACSYAAAG
ncbi:MAG: hypothetical protein ACRDRH_21125 [Pseudonocardia sp.]